MVYKASVQLHVNMRAKQRLGIHFNRHISRDIITKIQAKQFGKGYGAKGTKKTHRSWYNVEYNSLRFWALYDWDLNRIVTCLKKTPVEVEEYRQKRREAKRRLKDARDKV